MCRGPLRRSNTDTSRLALARCSACGHTLGLFPPALRQETEDYHKQYPEGEYPESLRETRSRQAEKLLDQIEGLLGPDPGLLDFGAGQGWFLESAKRRGWKNLAGADTSQHSRQSIAAMGIEVASIEGQGVLRSENLSFRPRVLTLLDVIEHFPTETVPRYISSAVESIGPTLELVVVKVPSNQGLLYRISQASARFGKTRLLEQLFQADTYPPHFHYFSKNSLDTLRRSLKWDAVASGSDLDFEPGSLAGRLRSKKMLSATFANLAGHLLALTARGLGMCDSQIAFWKPTTTPRSPSR